MKKRYKKRLYFALLIAFLVTFSYSFGMLTGAFKYPPYKTINFYYKKFLTEDLKEYETISSIYEETNVSSLISIKNNKDVIIKRNELTHYIWKGKGLPTQMPGSVENNIEDDRYLGLKNLERIDRITVTMDYGVNSIAYLFHPKKSNNKLVIYHQGHRGGFILGKRTIERFLKEGYSVLAFSMPLIGINNNPVVDTEFGKIHLTGHDKLILLETKDFTPIKFFLEPIAISLNYIKEKYGFGQVSIVGVSTGGWTATLYAAIDTRISKSYPVAATLPIYLRSGRDWGDYEQNWPELYRTANYLELYVLGSHGVNRKQLQIINKYDSCCFAGIKYRTYEQEIKNFVFSLGKGEFEVFLDDSHKGHKISDKAMKVILADFDS